LIRNLRFSFDKFISLSLLIYSTSTIRMEHPDWLWNPLEICRMGSFPFETGSSCCGITQKGEPCKNVIRQITLKSGRQNLDILAETPLNPANLKLQLQEIARDFLCTRWHRDRQSDSVAQKWYEAAMRNQPQAEVPPRNLSARNTGSRSNGPRLRTQHRHRSAPTVENSLNTSEGRTGDSVTAIDSADDISTQNEDDTVSETSAYRITPSTLLQGRIPWDISPSRPAILKIGDDNTGLRVLKLKSFTQHRNREQCYICHGTNDGSETDDPVTLHCGRCQFNVHLGCMQLWLGSLQSATPTTCPQW